VGSPVLSAAGAPKGLIALWFSPALLALALGALMLSGCATIAWTTPVVYSGPSLAFTEINLKSGTVTNVGAGACYTITVGDGEFEWVGHTWDLLDLSGLGCGGEAITPAGTAVSTLQVGGKLGTLNGIIGLAALSTPFATDGSGFAQGGSPGLILAGVVDVQAILANFENAAANLQKAKLAIHEAANYPLPRGGLAP
jgi:hypothetical protein